MRLPILVSLLRFTRWLKLVISVLTCSHHVSGQVVFSPSDSFLLPSDGVGVAVGPDGYYFHTDNGVEHRDLNGTLISNLGLPTDNLFGLAHDGTRLWAASNFHGRLHPLDDVRGWGEIVGPVLTDSRGLAAVGDFLYQIHGNGLMVRREKDQGTVLNSYDLSSLGILDPWGLGGNSERNELYAVNNDNKVFVIGISAEFNLSLLGIQSLPTFSHLVGFGYNNGRFAFINDSETAGFGTITVVPEANFQTVFAVVCLAMCSVLTLRRARARIIRAS